MNTLTRLGFGSLERALGSEINVHPLTPAADGCPGPQRGRYRRKNRSQLPWKMPSIASVE